jgi:hypothetical protein
MDQQQEHEVCYAASQFRGKVSSVAQTPPGCGFRGITWMMYMIILVDCVSLVPSANTLTWWIPQLEHKQALSLCWPWQWQPLRS